MELGTSSVTPISVIAVIIAINNYSISRKRHLLWNFLSIKLIVGYCNRQGNKRIETIVKSGDVTSQETLQLKHESANSFWRNNRRLFRETEETN
jgi:hypothetical protein